MQVILIRHAMPTVNASQPPNEWPLSPAGRAAYAALGRVLPDRAAWLSSTERKAVETLALARSNQAADMVQDDRFDEVVRPGEPFDDDVHDRRLAWVEGRPDKRHHGWESPEHGAERFQTAVSEQKSAEPLVIATHGMVLTAWLVSIGHVQPGRPAGAFWSRLAFPDVIRVSLPDAPTP
jgi:broad specificity phosphatase PhoE